MGDAKANLDDLQKRTLTNQNTNFSRRQKRIYKIGKRTLEVEPLYISYNMNFVLTMGVFIFDHRRIYFPKRVYNLTGSSFQELYCLYVGTTTWIVVVRNSSSLCMMVVAAAVHEKEKSQKSSTIQHTYVYFLLFMNRQDNFI